MTLEMIDAILRIFKAFVGENSERINEKALAYGIIMPDSVDDDTLDEAIELYGIKGNLLNNAFHKNFETVANSDIDTLYLQQIMHYITTYGFENLGIYNDKTIYIPAEELDIPELKGTLEFVSIKAISESQLSDMINNFVLSDVAFSKQTVEDIVALASYINKDDIDNIKNREVKTALCDLLNIVPNNAEEFLRYVIFKLTGNTLKIKNSDTFNTLKRSDKDKALNLFKTYLTNDEKYKNLSSIFLRNKLIFLALKGDNKELNSIINKLRKLAEKNHISVQSSCLDNLTCQYFKKDTIINALDKITVFKEMRILNALRLYDANPEFLGYKVRNGRMYMSANEKKRNLSREIDIVLNHLKERLSDKISGKVFYIDEGVGLALPVSEKQFCSEFPEGTIVKVPYGKNIVFGIHWFDKDCKRVDLDLHIMDISNNFYGWNSSIRDEDRTILFSGDMTAAPLPKGASEVYYINSKHNNIFSVYLNDFNYVKDVDFTFFVAGSDELNSKEVKNYVVDPNKVLLQTKNTIIDYSMSLGLVIVENNQINFVLSKNALGKNIIPNKDLSEQSLSFLLASFKAKMTLNELIEYCGGKVIATPTYMKHSTDKEGKEITEELSADYDFSSKSLTKDALISLFN